MCNEIRTKVKSKMSSEVKFEIKSRSNFDSKIKPKKSMEILVKKQLILPKKKGLDNYLASIRKYKHGPTSTSL
jgi:hypothetical protein